MRKIALGLACLALLGLTACKKTVQEKVAKQIPSAETEDAFFKAKVRSTLGSVAYLKNDDNFWTNLRVGQYIFENYRVRTFKESEAILNTNDGSVLILSENSDVEFTAEFREQVTGDVKIQIHDGNIQFDIQKQQKTRFSFMTGTATASIRGTAGFVGSLQGQLVASLKEGQVDVKDSKGKVTSVKQNETLLMTKSGEPKVMVLASSGTKNLTALLDSMARSGSLENVDELESNLNSFDENYREQMKAFEQNLTFEPTVIQPVVSQSEITLQARVNPGVIVTVMGLSDTVPENGVYKRSFSWDKSTAGTKRFMATCSNGEVEVPCNVWVTEYEVPTEANGEPDLDSVSTAADSLALAPVDSATEEPATVDSVVAAPIQKADVAEAPSSVRQSLVVKLGGESLELLPVQDKGKMVESELKIMLSGITDEELEQLESITILRDGKVAQVITDFSGLIYEVPVKLKWNQTVGYEVVAKLKSGDDKRANKRFTAR